jgi:quercetin dioxygenase-like cupin family protein
MLQSTLTQSIQITIGKNNITVDSLPWMPHASFKGVYLKHLITGNETDRLASFHLVRVDPGCALDQHIHPGKWELHEVLQGQGIARVGEEEINYIPGRIAIIPENTPHQIMAGETGLLIMAKFFPALL